MTTRLWRLIDTYPGEQAHVLLLFEWAKRTMTNYVPRWIYIGYYQEQAASWVVEGKYLEDTEGQPIRWQPLPKSPEHLVN